MGIDVEDLESLVRLVREHPEWRDALRHELLTDDLLTLPAADRLERMLAAGVARQDRFEAEMAEGFASTKALLDEVVRENREMDARLGARLDALAAQAAATDARLEELAAQGARTDARLEELARENREMDARLGARLAELAKQDAETKASLKETDARLSAALEDLARRSTENEARWIELRAEHEKTIARLDAAIERIDANTEGLRELGERMERRMNILEGRVGNHDGEIFEIRYNVGSQLSTLLGRVRTITVGDLDRVLDAREDGSLPEDQFRQLQAADFICAGREGRGPDAPEAYAVVEVSRVIDVDDVSRAADRAEVLRRCGYPRVYAAVGGQTILRDARELAAARGVHVLGAPAEAAPAAA